MKLNFSEKELKDFFEGRDAELLKKIYEDAANQSLKKEKTASSSILKN